MPDIPPQASTIDQQKVVMTSKDVSNDSRSAQNSTLDIGDVRELISMYIGQLIDGCNSPDCRETLCRTGRINIATAPVRTYKHRSARAIALTICAGPNPRGHLCSFYSRATRPRGQSGVDEPRDESSLIQRLCDTAVITSLANHADSASLATNPEFKELQGFHRQISALMDESVHKPGSGFRRNLDLVKALAPPLEWLLARVPLQSMASWQWADRAVISEGYAFPQKVNDGIALPSGPYNSGLVILDNLNHEPYLRLLERVCDILARRTLLEKTVADTTGRRPDQASCLRSVLISRLFGEGIQTMRALALLVWLKRAFAKHWNARTIIQGGSTCHGVLTMIDALYAHAYAGPHRYLQITDFVMPMIKSYLSTVELAESWLNFEAADERHIHLLQWSFMLSMQHFCLFFRSLSHILMRRAHSEVYRAHQLHDKVAPLRFNPQHSEQNQHERQYYLLLSVSRKNILQDAFDQLWQRKKSEFRRPLRVRLGEVDELEVGHDLGGVQIEFFNLVCRELFSEQAQLFATDSTTGCSYFRPGSLQPLYMFELVGLLIALAIYNGITLPVNLPWVFYYFLCHTVKGPGLLRDHTTPEKIADCWPATARSLRSILDEDIDDLELEYSFPLEANGLRLAALLPLEQVTNGKMTMSIISAAPLSNRRDPATAVNGQVSYTPPSLDYWAVQDDWPGWVIEKYSNTPQNVTSANKLDYVDDHIRWLTFSSVRPQLAAFLKGFHSAGLFEALTLRLFGTDRLKAYVEGSDTLDIDQLRAATHYEGYEAKSKYINSFWDILRSWPQEKQKQLLKFVTAAERIPITGASQLTFVIKRGYPENLNNLPTSSTCFGTLILPKYANVDTLEEKLSKAVEYGAVGFGNG